MTPAVSIHNFSYGYSNRKDWILKDVSLSVKPGECICFTGPSGCGKSTLFLALKGLLKGGRQEGRIHILNGHGKPGTGLAFQNAESHLLCTTVEDEVAFGPLNLGENPEAVKTVVKECLEAVSLTGFEDRNVESLSAGQAQRVALASVLATRSGILLLDEPTSQLDTLEKKRLSGLLASLKKAGHTLLIAEHELGPFESLADRYVILQQGCIKRIENRLPEGFRLEAPFEGQAARKGRGSIGKTPGSNEWTGAFKR